MSLRLPVVSLMTMPPAFGANKSGACLCSKVLRKAGSSIGYSDLSSAPCPSRHMPTVP